MCSFIQQLPVHNFRGHFNATINLLHCTLIKSRGVLSYVCLDNIINQCHYENSWMGLGGRQNREDKMEMSSVSLLEGQFKCTENFKSKQIVTLASGGTARSLFPTILSSSLIDSYTNQVVMKLLATNCSRRNLIVMKYSLCLPYM